MQILFLNIYYITNNRESSFSNIETIQIKGKDLVTVIDPIEYEGISISKNRNKLNQNLLKKQK